MNKRNKETTALVLRDRAKSFGKKAAKAVSAAVASSMVAVGSAMAAADIPADMAGADAWVRGKAGPIITFALVVSLIYIGIRVAKMPRRA